METGLDGEVMRTEFHGRSNIRNPDNNIIPGCLLPLIIGLLSRKIFTHRKSEFCNLLLGQFTITAPIRYPCQKGIPSWDHVIFDQSLISWYRIVIFG